MDKIIVKDLELFCYHGVNPEEKRDGQIFVFDIEAFLSLAVPCKTDNVDDTVSYAKIIKTVRRVAQSEKNDLLERVCQRVADALFEEFDMISALKIILKKPNAPIKAKFDYVAVEIERSRQ
ncbi:MAG: dihydroneopterin aldolase [Oscillospiraceae bacterium]|nr:dihydroneopterin aldolase [Oscillospiraceae bacterium]